MRTSIVSVYYKRRVFDDGTYSDTITIYVTILPLPVAGNITGIDSVCPGDTLTFIDTVSGGSWASANPAVATINTAGFATAHAPGLSVISYVVTNICGATAATFNLYVRSDCPNGVHNVNGAENRIVVFPNPGRGTFTISLQAAEVEGIEFSVTNVVGEKIKSFKTVSNKAFTIYLDEPPGVYFLSVVSAEGKYFEKITIAR